jgi:hypothetical protein
MGVVAVRVVPETATILAEGREVSGPEVRLAIGHRRIAATAPGFAPAERTVDVQGGVVQVIQLTLDPLPEGDTIFIDEATNPLVFVGPSVGLVGLGTAVASFLWFLNRDDAIGRCADAAQGGVACENASTIAGQRDLSIAGMALGAGIAAVGAVLLLLGVLDADEEPAP